MRMKTERKRRHVVKLRADAFERAVRLAKIRSDYALAQEMQVDRSTVSRVRSGSLRPGAVFIAGALKVLYPMRFEDLFEVD